LDRRQVRADPDHYADDSNDAPKPEHRAPIGRAIELAAQTAARAAFTWLACVAAPATTARLALGRLLRFRLVVAGDADAVGDVQPQARQ